MSDPIVFVGAKRTPFGAFGGSFQDITATELGVLATTAALNQGQVSPNQVDQVVFGNVIQSSKDAAYLSRHVALRSDMPITTPAVTINRLCGSGFEAIVQAARLLQTGEANVVVAGGTESMSQAPMVLRNARFGYRMGHGELEDALLAGLTDCYANTPMGITAENLAKEYKVSRTECDEFAARSQELAAKATENDFFKEEITPVTVKQRKKEWVVDKDEGIRTGTTVEKLSSLKPVFIKEGTVTAGNASGINDGAAALVLTKESVAKKNGWNILGEYVCSHVVGVEPSMMGIGPVGAIEGALNKASLSLGDLKRIEINEAFAAQYLACEKKLGSNRDITNTEGGAIALGHPLGTSGARITAHNLYQLQKLGGGFAMGSACIGGGQGIAVLVKVA